LSPAITLPSNMTSMTVSRDGIVSVITAGSTAATQVGTIQLASFVNVGGLQSAGENLYIETASSGTPTPNTPGSNGTGLLNQNYVETSNVNVAEELVSMIQTQRAYELNSKAIQTSDAMLGRLTQL
jgi:flagellar basal-body rod protein FlgG